jgi:serine phosphatase RsbU (regulator of sigma subunit)
MVSSPTRPAPLRASRETLPALLENERSDSLDEYVQTIIHQWSKTLSALGFTLIPLFFVLDYFMIREALFTRFAVYRLVTTAIVIAQYFVIRGTRPGRYSVLHGYFFSFVAAGMISLMTTELAGFNSTYYAGLNLVMIAANLLLPWRAIHSAINSAMIIGIYVLANLTLGGGEPTDPVYLINNMYFLTSTAVISVAINWMKEKLIREEFLARIHLRRARDALWGEMEIAKRIQTALLPKVESIGGYRVAATSLPAEEVGGDYYDVIQTKAGESWITIGDVSGHGVESGLIMMMTQTSIFTAVNRTSGLMPSEVLEVVNEIVSENIARLGTDRYMTLSAIVLRGDEMVFAGKHQDILIYRRRRGAVEAVPTLGTWLGVVKDLRGRLPDTRVRIDPGDIILLFTDGVTEAMSVAGTMFGEKHLRSALDAYADLEVDEIVSRVLMDVQNHMAYQADDITLVALERLAEGVGEAGQSGAEAA